MTENEDLPPIAPKRAARGIDRAVGGTLSVVRYLLGIVAGLFVGLLTLPLVAGLSRDGRGPFTMTIVPGIVAFGLLTGAITLLVGVARGRKHRARSLFLGLLTGLCLIWLAAGICFTGLSS